MEETAEKAQRVAHAEAAIRAVLGDYERALNAGDAALAAGCYAADALMIAAGQPTVAGPDLLEAYTQGFGVFRLEVEFEVDELVVASDTVAYALTRSNGHQVLLASGDRVPEANREIFIFGVEDGAWKIRRYLFNQPS